MTVRKPLQILGAATAALGVSLLRSSRPRGWPTAAGTTGGSGYRDACGPPAGPEKNRSDRLDPEWKHECGTSSEAMRPSQPQKKSGRQGEAG